jgi:putative transposase
VGIIKRECLNFFLCFSMDQLHYITQTWVRHYLTQRPHRGVGMSNNVLDEQFTPQREGPVRCREKLGGLIKEYYREAA